MSFLKATSTSFVVMVSLWGCKSLQNASKTTELVSPDSKDLVNSVRQASSFAYCPSEDWFVTASNEADLRIYFDFSAQLKPKSLSPSRDPEIKPISPEHPAAEAEAAEESEIDFANMSSGWADFAAQPVDHLALVPWASRPPLPIIDLDLSPNCQHLAVRTMAGLDMLALPGQLKPNRQPLLVNATQVTPELPSASTFSSDSTLLTYAAAPHRTSLRFASTASVQPKVLEPGDPGYGDYFEEELRTVEPEFSAAYTGYFSKDGFRYNFGSPVLNIHFENDGLFVGTSDHLFKILRREAGNTSIDESKRVRRIAVKNNSYAPFEPLGIIDSSEEASFLLARQGQDLRCWHHQGKLPQHGLYDCTPYRIPFPVIATQLFDTQGFNVLAIVGSQGGEIFVQFRPLAVIFKGTDPNKRYINPVAEQSRLSLIPQLYLGIGKTFALDSAPEWMGVLASGDLAVISSRTRDLFVFRALLR